jgi:hypothetical protein
MRRVPTSVVWKLIAASLLLSAAHSLARPALHVDGDISETQNVFSFPKPAPSAKDEVFEHDLFVPLGFSRQGELAFLHKAPRAETEHNLTLNIVDLRSDKFVFTKSFDARDKKFADLSRAVRGEWTTALKKHSISPQTDLRGRTYPFTYGSENFSVVVRLLKDDLERMESHYEVRLVASSLGEKVVGKVTIGTSDRVGRLEPVVALISPHEPRAALILGHYRRTNGMTYTDGAEPIVLGARLDAGFKKVLPPTKN